MKTIIIALSGAALSGAAIGVAPVLSERLARPATYADTVTGCSVTDGDTIRCGDERIRLLGIDAP